MENQLICGPAEESSYKWEPVTFSSCFPCFFFSATRKKLSGQASSWNSGRTFLPTLVLRTLPWITGWRCLISIYWSALLIDRSFHCSAADLAAGSRWPPHEYLWSVLSSFSQGLWWSLLTRPPLTPVGAEKPWDVAVLPLGPGPKKSTPRASTTGRLHLYYHDSLWRAFHSDSVIRPPSESCPLHLSTRYSSRKLNSHLPPRSTCALPLRYLPGTPSDRGSSKVTKEELGPRKRSGCLPTLPLRPCSPLVLPTIPNAGRVSFSLLFILRSPHRVKYLSCSQGVLKVGSREPPSDPQDQNHCHNTIVLFPFPSFRSIQWGFPEDTWHVTS